jgi:starch-binding outer membrane protein, SusD/RagB family
MKFNIKKTKKGVIQYILPFMVMVSMLVSCTKFLEENPTANLTSAYTFTTAAEGNALVVGGYRNLAGIYTGGGGDYGNYLSCVMEYWAGESYSLDSHPMFLNFQTNQVAGTMLQNFDNYWNNNYGVVKDCNNAIQKINGITEYTADDKSKKMTEVRTLRALAYFNLVRYYGDVPYDTALSTFSASQKPRVSLKKIYDEIIIPDLEFAVNGTKEDIKTDGSISKNAARAILADVYLTCAGYPYQEVATDATKPWCTSGAFSQQTYPVVSVSAAGFLTKAKALLDALYGKYTLASTYRDLHDPAKINNKSESIFQIQQASGLSEMTGFIGATLPPAQKCASITEYGTLIPTTGYYNSYDAADLRKQDRTGFFYSNDYQAPQYDASVFVRFAQPMCFKYYDSVGLKTSGGHSGLNFTLYRYADILLMLTEVNWALTQNGVSVLDADVTKGINEVRRRAKLPDLAINQISNLTIFSERAWELMFEVKMVWDQRRSRKCLIDGSGAFGIENFIGHKATEFNYKFTAQHLLAPISQAEILNNANCLQNFTYLPKQAGQ